MKIIEFQRLLKVAYFFPFLFVQVLFGQKEWARLDGLPGSGEVLSLLSYQDQMYAGIAGKGVIFSSDGGITWENSAKELQFVAPWTLAEGRGKLFLGTLDHGLWRSDDGGKSWKAKNQGLIQSSIYALVFSQNRLFAGTGLGVFYSDDEGENWVAAKMPQPTSHNQIIFSLLATKKHLIAGSSKNIFIADQDGLVWEEVVTGNRFDNRHLLLDEKGTLIIGSTGDGLKKWDFDKSSPLNPIVGTEQGRKDSLISAIVLRDSVLLRATVGDLKLGNNSLKGDLPNENVKALMYHQGVLYAGTEQSGLWKYEDRKVKPIFNANTSNLGEKLEVFPNPGKDWIALDYQLEQSGRINLALFDMKGRKIMEIEDGERGVGVYRGKIDSSNLQPGSYFVVLQTAANVFCKKLFVLN